MGPWTNQRRHFFALKFQGMAGGRGRKAGTRTTQGFRTGLLPARWGRRPRVAPAEGAGAGLSAHRGGRAGDPASCAPARVPPPALVPAAGRTPEPALRSLRSRAALRGREEGTAGWPSTEAACEAQGRKARTRGGEGWRRPGAKPEGRALSRRPGTHGPQRGSGLGAADARASVRQGHLDGRGTPTLDTLDRR